MSQPLLRTTSPPDLRRWLPLIIGLAVGIRGALGWIHPFYFPDSADYDTLARALLTHQPYSSAGFIASRIPGYPFFLALIYFFFGTGTHAVMIIQALLSGGVVLFTFLIAKRISTTVGLIAAMIITFDPLSIGFSAALLSESPFTLTFMAALWLALRISETPTDPLFHRAFRWLALGILWSIAVYLRAEALYCILLLAPAIISNFRKPYLLQNISLCFLPAALVFLLLMPWLLRNHSHFPNSSMFTLTSLEGISLYESVYPGADGGPMQDKITLPPEMQSLDEMQRSGEWSRRAWSFIRADPLRIAKLAFIKIGRTWSPWFNASDFRSGPIQWAMIVWYIPLYLFALLGLWRMPRSLAILLLIPITYFTLLHALFLGSVRYRVPLMPILSVFAAVGIVNTLNSALRYKRRAI
jgi:hypothetical protein